MSGIKRIDRTHSGLADEVYQRLVDALLQGAIGPGDRLIQDRLAADLDVSRTPVRDALLRLNEEGVIEPSGRRGYVVRRLSQSDVLALYEAREAIEGHAAALVAEKGGAAVEQVRAAIERATARRARSTREAFEANRAIHRAIVSAAGNAHLLGFFDAVWGRALAGLAYQAFHVSSQHDEFVEDHRDVLAAIASGRPEHARSVMLDHIARGLAQTPAAPDGDVLASGPQA